MAERKKLEAAGQEPEARAINTSGIVAVLRTLEREIKVVLFFTGHAHAGDNLGTVLVKRASELEAPMHMSDGLALNIPRDFATVLCNCLAHGRRKFVELGDHFPDECRHVIEVLAKVYDNDARCREQAMSRQERLVYHKAHSGPPMDELKTWMDEQFIQRQVEPNSGLGDAMNYILKRWDKLTLFLRRAGPPLGRVEMWRGGRRSGLSVAPPFVWRCPSNLAVAPFPHPLVEPDVRISRIRLSSDASSLRVRAAAFERPQAYQSQLS